MNSSIIHENSFSVSIIKENGIYPVTYNINLLINTITENTTNQNVAFQRIICVIETMLNKHIFVHYENPNLEKIFKMFSSNNIILLPEKPYDSVIGMLLFHKLNAITEGYVEIDSIDISSNGQESNSLSKVSYLINDRAQFNVVIPKAKMPYWWDRPDLTFNENKNHLTTMLKWEDYQLTWDTEELISSENEDFVVEVEDGGLYTENTNDEN
jgi:hypothetical protein